MPKNMKDILWIWARSCPCRNSPLFVSVGKGHTSPSLAHWDMHAFFPRLAALEERPYWCVRRPWPPVNARQTKANTDRVVDLFGALNSMLFCYVDQMLFTNLVYHVSADVPLFQIMRGINVSLRVQQSHSQKTLKRPCGGQVA